jgi:hypothetical protein
LRDKLEKHINTMDEIDELEVSVIKMIIILIYNNNNNNNIIIILIYNNNNNNKYYSSHIKSVPSYIVYTTLKFILN